MIRSEIKVAKYLKDLSRKATILEDPYLPVP